MAEKFTDGVNLTKLGKDVLVKAQSGHQIFLTDKVIKQLIKLTKKA